MKLTIDRDTLVDVLFRVQGVCAQKSTLPILSSCLIEAHPEGKIEVHGTDLDISVSTSAAANVLEEGRVALAAKRLFDTVKTLPEGRVQLETEPNHWATLNAGRIHARLAGNHPDEYPQLPVFDDSTTLSLPASLLIDMVEKVFFSISTDEARASFMGAFLCSSDDDALQMVSTDGHRLSKIERSLAGSDEDPDTPVHIGEIPDKLREGLIVPRKGLSELRRVIPADGMVQLRVKGDDLLIEHDSTRLAIRLIPGRFPNFSQVIPKGSEHHIRASRESLLQALRRAAHYTAKTGNTRLSASEDTLEVHAFDPEIGEIREPVRCQYNGPGISAGYNYRYLLEVLNVVEGDDVVIEMINTESPTVIRDPARPDALFIVMPMQF